jgi:RES domain-containing protein
MAEKIKGPRWDVIVRRVVHPRKLEIIELLSKRGPLSASELRDQIASSDPTATLQQVNFHTVWLAERGVLVPSATGPGVGNVHRTFYALARTVVG